MNDCQDFAREDSKMSSKPNNVIGYTIFGCQMFLYTGVMTVGFGGMDFSTGETFMSDGEIAGCAFVLGAIGAIFGGGDWLAHREVS